MLLSNQQCIDVISSCIPGNGTHDLGITNSTVWATLWCIKSKSMNESNTCWSEWAPAVRQCSSTPHTRDGYLSVTISMSKSGGSLASIPPASSSTISCGHRQTRCQKEQVHRTANHEWLMISSHLWWFGSAASLSRQSQQHSVQQLIGLLVVFGDVSVAVEAEDLRFSSDGKVADVVHVILHTKEIVHLFWFECKVMRLPATSESKIFSE